MDILPATTVTTLTTTLQEYLTDNALIVIGVVAVAVAVAFVVRWFTKSTRRIKA